MLQFRMLTFCPSYFWPLLIFLMQRFLLPPAPWGLVLGPHLFIYPLSCSSHPITVNTVQSTTPKFTFLIQTSLSSKLECSVVHLTFHLHLNASQAPQTYIEFKTYLPTHKTHFSIFLMIPQTTQLLNPKSQELLLTRLSALFSISS